MSQSRDGVARRSGRTIQLTRTAVLSAPAGLARRLEHTEVLDRLAGPLTQAVARRMPPQSRLADTLHGTWLGQPVHPGLTTLPLGCWTSATVLDFVPGVPGARHAARVLLALGLAGTLPTAAAGLADWSALHPEQQRVGLFHAASGAGATALFAASLLARMTGRDGSGRLLALGGLTAVTVGSFVGRHLAFGLGAGASHAESVAHLAPLGWHDLCRSYELPNGRLARRQLGYLALTVLRQGTDVFALADQCAHLGGPLHQGSLTQSRAGPCVICPWHGSTFAMTDGSVVHGPATARQPAFETRIVEGGMVQVRPVQPGRARFAERTPPVR